MGFANSKAKRLVWCCAILMVLVALVGCAPRAAVPSERGEATGSAAPEVAFTWSADADCSPCHNAESASMADSACQAAAHEQNAITCTSCHNDAAGLTAAHEGSTTSSKMPTKLTKTKITEQMCLSCHESREALAVKTANSTVLVDSLGTVVNPHALPASDGHAGIACADCHQMHAAGTPGDLAKKTCISCHHEDVFECGTCHEEQ
ncbi:cytochrome c3 family protein [Gordonibacter sp.]|uniref:cytochrome c3 family protein n=1 Tax=Gordonibacter sp. TaxID=1968902 RepID=UPI002FCC7C19